MRALVSEGGGSNVKGARLRRALTPEWLDQFADDVIFRIIRLRETVVFRSQCIEYFAMSRVVAIQA